MILSNHGRSLHLRQTTPDDAPLLLRAYEDDAFISLYRSNHAKQSEEQLRQTLAKRKQHAPTQLGYLELMLEHQQHGPIGIAALGDYSPLHQRAEYLIGLFDEQHRYAGYGIEATLLILDLAFNSYHLNKVYSYVYEYNDFSHKNMLHLGFKHEGTLAQHHYSVRLEQFITLYLNGMTIKQFRENEKIQRLSLRLVGRDITQPPQVFEISAENKLPAEANQQFLERLKAKANLNAT
ncbi:MAG: GNAT family N-acetyltransferase [Candidatus Parabeggiatoa sp. nov. 3]|nr:MAG: GNAT family N-acetyltransferase [Gammaproteobacteria bacterium]RKZ62877.1 MAG: GNAT family N-acetyltransferase [Gammaproteobacteria bacterium]RKZ89181.1 MAG: GNAT family N-acetyltransferase [Gammaproteobacteria bacterium]HEW97425.1 N-acetyltransferase [Beggiatoa sp.]